MSDIVYRSATYLDAVDAIAALGRRNIANVVVLRGKRIIIDLSLDGELLVTREQSAQFDDRETM